MSATVDGRNAVLQRLYPARRVRALAYGPMNIPVWAAIAYGAGWMTREQMEAAPMDEGAPEHVGNGFFWMIKRPETPEAIRQHAAWERFNLHARPYIERGRKRDERKARRR